MRTTSALSTLSHATHAAGPAPETIHAARIGAGVLFFAVVLALAVIYRRLVERARAEEAALAIEREFEELERDQPTSARPPLP